MATRIDRSNKPLYDDLSEPNGLWQAPLILAGQPKRVVVCLTDSSARDGAELRQHEYQARMDPVSPRKDEIPSIARPDELQKSELLAVLRMIQWNEEQRFSGSGIEASRRLQGVFA